MTYKICPDHATRQSKGCGTVIRRLIEVRTVLLQQVGHLNRNGCVQMNRFRQMMQSRASALIRGLQTTSGSMSRVWVCSQRQQCLQSVRVTSQHRVAKKGPAFVIHDVQVASQARLSEKLVGESIKVSGTEYATFTGNGA